MTVAKCQWILTYVLRGRVLARCHLGWTPEYDLNGYELGTYRMRLFKFYFWCLFYGVKFYLADFLFFNTLNKNKQILPPKLPHYRRMCCPVHCTVYTRFAYWKYHNNGYRSIKVVPKNNENERGEKEPNMFCRCTEFIVSGHQWNRTGPKSCGATSQQSKKYKLELKLSKLMRMARKKLTWPKMKHLLRSLTTLAI